MADTPVSVFISYSRTDSAFIDRLEADLRAYGFDTWVDRQHLEGGADWARLIEQQIVRCETLIVALSSDAVTSTWVRREITFALNAGKHVIPIIVRPVERIPIEIIEKQYIDLSADYASGLQELRVAMTRSHARSQQPAQVASFGDLSPSALQAVTPSPLFSPDLPSPAAPLRYAPPSPATSQQASLIMRKGQTPGRSYTIAKTPFTIGRGRDDDLFLEDLAVSRLHATITRGGNGQYEARDENSANGVLVNGNRISVHGLQSGDEIQIGQTTLEFRLA